MALATLVYSASAATAGATNFDFTAATDSDFTQRNGHYTFTEDYNLAALAVVGASVTRGRIQSPTLNALGEVALFGSNRSATVPANPFVEMFMPMNNWINLPKNEEIQIQYSNNLGAATEQETAILWLTTDDWSANLPTPAAAPFNVTAKFRASFTLTPTVNAWSGPQPIALSASLRNGVWSVVGAYVQGGNAAAWRIVFPKFKLYNGRKMRPGGIIQTAVGDMVPFNWPYGERIWGEFGRFHTFELPQIDIFGLTAASTTYQVFLDLVYLGTDIGLLAQGLGAS